MFEHVSSALDSPYASDLDLLECMHVLAQQDWSAFLGHPWMLSAVETATPPFGTAALAGMEWALGALAPLGLPPHEAARAVMTINIYMQGTARVLRSEEHTSELQSRGDL